MSAFAVVAPGRVNLIGEHVDYAGGLVLPAAIERGLRIDVTPVVEPVLRLTSATQPGQVEVMLDGAGPAATGWGRYAAAVAAELRALDIPLRGIEGRVTSDLPAGSGLSSSAALEVAVAVALLERADAELPGMAIAEACQRAEQRAVGVPCGVMDQAASALAEEGCALLLDCATLATRAVPLPAGLALVVVDSGVRRRLEESRYALRRSEVDAALAVLPAGAARTLDPEEALDRARAAGLDGAPLRRLRHVVGERLRVERVVAALERPEGPDRSALARAFAEGHASMRDDFEASAPEVDALVELALEEGAIAARITGGGFGGAIVALADAAGAQALAARVAERHTARTGLPAATITSRPAAGARVLPR